MAGAWECATGPSMYIRVLRNLEECYSGFCSAAARHFTDGMNERKENTQKWIFFLFYEAFSFNGRSQQWNKSSFFFCFPLKFNGGFMTRKREEASVR